MWEKLKLFWRLIQINLILARYGLDKVILSFHLFFPIRFLVYLNPWNWWRRRDYNRAQAIRLALEELGPIYVKFGQVLSTRRDLLPSDVAAQLSLLQDHVPPFSSVIARANIEKSLGQPIEQCFTEFNDTPLASASIAQVHSARLDDGRECVIKVLRPNVRKSLERDIRVLYALARLVERYLPNGKRLRPVSIVKEFEKTFTDELDLMREAANASELKRNAVKLKYLYIPEIYWPYCRNDIMVMERIYGIPIADMAALDAARVNRKLLAERGVEIFFTQVFEDCFFHADMHPGNIFVDAKDPDDPKYIAVDFGIVGSLSDDDKRYLAANFLAFFNRNYREVARLHIESGWVPTDTRIDEFEGAIRAVCEPILQRPLKEISAAKVLERLMHIGRRFNMVLLPQLILLQKTLFNIEGLGRNLYPDLDLWESAKPILETWMRRQMGLKPMWRKLKRLQPFLVDHLPELPLLLHAALKQPEKPEPAKPARTWPAFCLGAVTVLIGLGLGILIS